MNCSALCCNGTGDVQAVKESSGNQIGGVMGRNASRLESDGPWQSLNLINCRGGARLYLETDLC
jgi:hypothetical protein